MTETTKQRFIALYLVPTSVIDNWMNTDPETRKPAEDKMRADWGAWMGKHGSMIVDTQAAGKTKLVTPAGVSDSRNDVMLYSIVEAETHEAAAKAFESHPHLGIPQSSIEIMAIRSM